jgi:predicted PurR-regulated permease PerM
MAIIHKIIKGGSDFWNSIKTDNKKQLAELDRLETQMAEIQEKEKTQAPSTPFVVTNRMFVKFWAFGVLIIFIGLFVYKSLSILYLIFMAYILSLAIEAIIDFFQKKLSYRGISIALAYLVIIIVFLGAMIFIIPFVLNQLSDVMTIFINNISHFQKILETKSLLGVIQDAHWLP